MMSKSKSVLLALITLVISGVMVASASALTLPDISLTLSTLPGPLACYRVSNFKVAESAANWGNAECKGTEHAKLTVEFVLAEPVQFIAGTPNLWCAKITPYKAGNNTETGTFSNAACTSRATNGEYIEVIWEAGPHYPVHLQGSTLGTAKTTLGSSAGVTLEGEGLTLLLLTTELSALGTFSAIFTHVGAPGGSECETNSLGKGNIQVTGEFHVVPLNTTGTPGILYLVTFVKIPCGTATFTVRGDVIGSLEKTSGEVTSVKGGLTGSKGVPGITEFLNDGGTKVKAALESDAGTGFVAADENVAEEVKLEVLGSQMIEITNE